MPHSDPNSPRGHWGPVRPRRPRRFAGVRDAVAAGIMAPLPALDDGVSLDAVATLFLEDPANDYAVLVDAGEHPVRLVDRAALLRAEPYEREPTTIAAESPLAVVAQCATSRPAGERFDPVVCTDDQGRYVGAVRVEDLLQALAGLAS